MYRFRLVTINLDNRIILQRRTDRWKNISGMNYRVFVVSEITATSYVNALHKPMCLQRFVLEAKKKRSMRISLLGTKKTIPNHAKLTVDIYNNK